VTTSDANLLARTVLALATLICLAAPPLAAQDRWELVLAPYLLAPSISGTTTLGRLGGDISVDTGDILDNMEAGGMLRFEARHDTGFGFALDYSMMKLGKGATSQAGQIRADYDLSVFDAVASYSFGRDGNRFDAYAGLRHWDIDLSLEVLTGAAVGNLQRGGDWSDPIIGLRWQRRLSPKWRMMMQGDVGGFGVASDFTWNLMGGLAYDRWQNISLFMTYRALGVDYETGTPGTPSYFEYDTVTQSLLAGVGFRF